MFENLTKTIKNKFMFPNDVRQNMESLLSKMGASTKKTVAVSVSQNIGIEMLEIDNIAGVVTKYAIRELAYDSANRKIESYSRFAEQIKQIFDEFGISYNSNVVLSLPNIYFGLIEMPNILHGEAVRNVILSEVEQSYIFKSNEPLVSWHNLFDPKKDKNKPNSIIYSAIQKEVIDGILDACQEIGCQFLTIENSLLSIMRGLSFLDYSKDYIKDDLPWQLLVVDATSFSVTTMVGATPINYFEEPLAMKAFEEGEIYKSIASAANDVLNNKSYGSVGLFIVSQTDFVSGEILRNEINTSQPIEVIECNKYSSNILYPVAFDISGELAEQISLAAIGTAALSFYPYPISLNYIKENIEELQQIDDQIGNIKINIGNLELSITRDTIRKLALICAGVMLVPLALVYLLIGQLILPKEEEKSNQLAKSIESVNQEIQGLTQTGQNTQFDIKTAAKKSVNQNKTLLLRYSVIGEVLPKNLWVTHIEEKNSDLYISGVSTSTHVIYEFYANLKKVLNNQTLILSKLQFSNESLDKYIANSGKISDSMYIFEITSSKNVTKTNEVGRSFNLSTVEEKPVEDSNSGRITTSGVLDIKANTTQNNLPNNSENNSNSQSPSNDKLPPNLKKIENIGG